MERMCHDRQLPLLYSILVIIFSSSQLWFLSVHSYISQTLLITPRTVYTIGKNTVRVSISVEMWNNWVDGTVVWCMIINKMGRLACLDFFQSTVRAIILHPGS